MEFGHWTDVAWERGGGKQGEKGDEDNSRFLRCALGGLVMLLTEKRKQRGSEAVGIDERDSLCFGCD